MYEDQTQEVIQQRVLDRVSNSIDKREGSIIQTATAPVSTELAQVYVTLDSMRDESFADTQSREYLIRRAAERGLSPIPASPVTAKGVFNLDTIPLGSRFACDDFIYYAYEKISNKNYKLVCETPGTAPNSTTGTLLSMDTIEGLEEAEITEILIPGTDEEDTEVFRARYWASFDTKPFGGNRTDYINATLNISGVGAVKVHRASSIKGDDGTQGGNVRLVILDSDYDIPSSTLLSLVKNTIDPVGVNGDGDGLGTAPMWHHVHVEAATATIINLTISFTFDTGYTYALLEDDIKDAIDEYLMSLTETWQNSSSGLVVRKTYIQNALLDIEGILDATVTAINGNNSNLILHIDAIPQRGTITCS